MCCLPCLILWARLWSIRLDHEAEAQWQAEAER